MKVSISGSRISYFLCFEFFYLHFRDNLLELRIYFESLTYSDVKQVPSYDLYNLLGGYHFFDYYDFSLFFIITYGTIHYLKYTNSLTTHYLQCTTYDIILTMRCLYQVSLTGYLNPGILLTGEGPCKCCPKTNYLVMVRTQTSRPRVQHFNNRVNSQCFLGHWEY